MTRDSQGKFSRTKKWGKRMFTVLFALVLAAFAVDQWYLTEARLTGEYIAPSLVQEVLAEIPGKTYEEKIANVKARMLGDLSLGCETKDKKDPDGEIIFDSNRVASVGRFQFQLDTIKRYVKRFEGRDISSSEAIKIAIDPEKSTALAEKIIFAEVQKGEKEGWRNWFNCGSKLKIADKVAIIKEIESL